MIVVWEVKERDAQSQGVLILTVTNF